MKAALILAAGFGSRLRPYTDICPKPILPVAGLEPLFFALWRAKTLGVEKFYINAHYKSERILKFVEEVVKPRMKIDVEVIVENPVLGTGGAILNLLKLKSAKDIESLIVTNGDTLLGFDIEKINLNLDKNWCLVSTDPSYLTRYKPLWYDGVQNYCAVGSIDDPKTLWSPAHFLGLHCLNNKALSKLRENLNEVVEVDLFRGIYKPLREAGLQIEVVDAHLSKADFWFDMTNKDFFLEAQTRLLELSAKNNDTWLEAMNCRYGVSYKKFGTSFLWGHDSKSLDWTKTKNSFVVNINEFTSSSGFASESSVLLLANAGAFKGKHLIHFKKSLLMCSSEKQDNFDPATELVEDEILLI